MDTVLDHTFVPANDPKESVRFYTAIMGFQQGENFGPFEVVRAKDEHPIPHPTVSPPKMN